MSRRALRAGLACVLAASAAHAQDRFIAGGATPTGGIGGVEYIRHLEISPVGFAVGVGVTGVGARVQLRVRDVTTVDGFNTRYLSAGVLVQPFPGNRGFDAPFVALVEYGTEFTGGPLYASMAGGGGMALRTDGSWMPVPSLRLIFGAAF